MAKLSPVDWDIIDARVQRLRGSQRLKTASTAFLWLVLQQYFPNLSDDFGEIITDGSDDRGIDAVHVIEGDDQAVVYLFQAKYRDSLASTDKTINEPEIHKIAIFLHELRERSEHLAACSNFRLQQAVKCVWDLHKRGIVCRYQVVLCSNDQGISHGARGILESSISGLEQVKYEYYGPDELLRDIASADRRAESGSIQVVSKELFERSDGDIRGVIASIDARSFVDLISTNDGAAIKRHLFDENLRVFLGATGGYNPEIIRTATSPDSHLFWYLNNGITITCRNFSYNKGHPNPIIKLEDFQIVNGAQTSHSLIEAATENPTALENVVLMVRIYATRRSDIAERVAVATNSQARIQDRDLRANNSVLKKLELAFGDRGYFLERKRNMHSDRDILRRIDAMKLGQIILAYYLQEPDRAKTDSDSIFGHRFFEIFHEHHNVDELIRLFELYQTIEAMRAEVEGNGREHSDDDGTLQYLIYGHWFVLYVSRLLLRDRRGNLPAREDAPELIREALTLIAKACSQSRSVAHYQMFRSPKTKHRILAELEPAQLNLLDLLDADAA